MKTIPAILVAFTALTMAVRAEDLQSKPGKTSDAELKKQQRAASSIYTVDAPNRIQGRTVVYRGTVPQAIKSRNPLQLINPFAPMEHGHGSQNLATPFPGEAPKIIAVSVEF